MIANVIWNMKKTDSGIVPVSLVVADAGQECLAEAAPDTVRCAAVAEGDGVAR